MPVLRFCPRHGREGTRERNGGVAMCISWLVFRDGNMLRRVAKALIPLDIPHLALGKENGVEILNVKQKPKTKR